MNIPHKYVILTALIFFFACAAYSTHEYLFFVNELRNENVSQVVRIGNRTYAVDRGVVSYDSIQVSGITALRALRVAYAKTLAERSPLLGLEGTDPDALRANTTLLKETMTKISLLQETAEDTKLVKNALYPIDFLYGLASLEEARKQFISSGSELDFDRYVDLFDPVFISGVRDSKKLADAYAYLTSSNRPPQTVSFAGTLSATSTTASLASIPESFARLQKQAHRRSLCLSGITWFCPPLSLPRIEEHGAQPPQPEGGDARPTFETEIASIFRSAPRTNAYDKSYAPVRLEQSVCLASLPSPYNFEASILLRINFDLLHYLDDMYFIPTAGKSGPVPVFLRDEYGLRYIKINPMTFYLCPHLVEDVSVAQATLRTVTVAKKYADIPNSHRAVLLSGVPSLRNAIAYIGEAIGGMQNEQLPIEYTHEVVAISSMFAQKSAALDAVVAHIVDITAHDLTVVQKGVPFDLRAKTLFYTHTATPSLFLFHQIGALSPLAPNSPNDRRNLQTKFGSYSTLREEMTDGALIREIRLMENIEKNGL